jgi:glycogen debranching enzyme
MISLEGLALSTGRAAEARDTLLTFAQHLNQGLIPNLFPKAISTASTTQPTRRCGSSTRSTAT